MKPHPNDPYGFVPQCVHCDDTGCDRCCETAPVTLQDLEQIEHETVANQPRRVATQSRPCRSNDFCLIHGYEGMRSRLGDPVPYCEACEREARIDGEGVTK